jgi:hypothetical protein
MTHERQRPAGRPGAGMRLGDAANSSAQYIKLPHPCAIYSGHVGLVGPGAGPHFPSLQRGTALRKRRGNKNVNLSMLMSGNPRSLERGGCQVVQNEEKFPLPHRLTER